MIETARPRPDVRRTLQAGLAGLLGAVALKGLLSDYGWLIDVALTIVVVIGPAALIRLRRPPGALDIWPGVILMIPWLTLRFLPHHAYAGVIPTGATMHDLSLMITSLHQTSQHEVAPIESTPAVRLVLCALVGLLAALIDLIAVVGRRGALAGIPLLVIYTVSGAVPRRAVAWEWFVAAACGFLLLLSLDASDDRESWGRRLSGVRPAPRHDGASGAVSGRSAPWVGAVGIVIAIVIPLVLPVGSANLLSDAFHHGHGQEGFGAQSGSGGSISPFALLQNELNRGAPKDIATVRILDGDKSVVPFYLRVNVLDDYTAAGWAVSNHGDLEPIENTHLQVDPENDNPRSSQFKAQITINGLTGNAPLFAAPSWISGVARGTNWSSKDELLLDGDVTRNQKIVEVVNQPSPTVAQLNAATGGGPDVSQWLAKPQLPSYVTTLVANLTAKAKTPYQRAHAISDYFTSPHFTYSTRTTVGDSGSALVDFLKSGQGFCQQYAAAMGIMLRQAGVPSRVVLGYEHEQPDSTRSFTVTTNDAHAWVEAYFPGVGWIPFDPTPPAGLTGGAKSDLPWARHNYGPGAQGNAEPDLNKPGQAKTSAPARPSTSAPSAPVAAATTSPPSNTPWAGILTMLGIIAVLALALIPAGVRGLRRRRRLSCARAGDVAALWAELSDTVVDLGYTWSDARTPRQVARWLAQTLGQRSAALDSLAAAVEQRRFGPASDAPQPVDARELTVGLRRITDELRQLRSRRTRVSARLWPASLRWRLSRFDLGSIRLTAGTRGRRIGRAAARH